MRRTRDYIKEINIGTTFYEKKELQTVTRVTDRQFDTHSQSDGIRVRSLGIFESVGFQNSISGFTPAKPVQMI